MKEASMGRGSGQYSLSPNIFLKETIVIRSVGIDLSRSGSHQVRCLDEQARPCDSFSFESTSEGLEKLEKFLFSKVAALRRYLREKELFQLL